MFGPIVQVDAGGDVRVAGAPDPDDAAVLDPDVRLHDAEERVDDEHAGDQHVELAVGGGAVVLRHPRADVLRVAPQRLVAVSDVVVLDADPQVGVAQAHAVARGRPVAARVLLARELSHRNPPAAIPDERDLAGLPRLHRTDAPAGRSSRKPRAASRSNASRGFARQKG